jgi:hypothetical protein
LMLVAHHEVKTRTLDSAAERRRSAGVSTTPRKRLPPLETYIRYGVPEQSGRHPEFRCRVGDRRQV